MGRTKNTFRGTKTEKGSKPKKSTRKKSSSTKSTRVSKRTPEQRAERLQKIKTALGLFLILFGIYLLIAFVSYIFTWKADQDKVFHFSWAFIFDLSGETENMLGNLGASLSHQFFYNLFGIASFFIPSFMLLAGINLFFKKKIFPAKKYGVFAIYLTLFISLVFGFFLAQEAFSWGGAFGNITNQWLKAILGKIGTAILLFFIFIGGLIFIFNIDPLQFFRNDS